VLGCHALSTFDFQLSTLNRGPSSPPAPGRRDEIGDPAVRLAQAARKDAADVLKDDHVGVIVFSVQIPEVHIVQRISLRFLSNPHRRRPRLKLDQRHLAEAFARAQLNQGNLLTITGRADDLHLALRQKVHRAAELPGVENRAAGGKLALLQSADHPFQRAAFEPTEDGNASEKTGQSLATVAAHVQQQTNSARFRQELR